MNDTSVKARLLIHSINFDEDWKNNPTWFASLVDSMVDSGFREPLNVKLPRRSWKNVGRNVAVSHIVEGRGGEYIVDSVDNPDSSVEFYDNEISLKAEFIVGIRNCPEQSIQSLIDLAHKISSLTQGVGIIGPVFWIDFPGLAYPRPLPPREDPRWWHGVLFYLLSTEYFSSQSEGDTGSIARLQSADMPPGLSRKISDGLLMIGPTNIPKDEIALKAALSQLEQWTGETLDLPRDKDFNAAGDKMQYVAQSERTPPFSFYDVAARRAYKVVAEDAENRLDEETIKDLREIMPMAELPDGRNIEERYVIFAFREGAVANSARVRALGGDGVLYLDEDGTFRNPFPPGDWIGRT